MSEIKSVLSMSKFTKFFILDSNPAYRDNLPSLLEVIIISPFGCVYAKVTICFAAGLKYAA